MVNAVRFLCEATCATVDISHSGKSTGPGPEVTFQEGDILCCDEGSVLSENGDSVDEDHPAVYQDLYAEFRWYTAEIGSFEVIELVPKGGNHDC